MSLSGSLVKAIVGNCGRLLRNCAQYDFSTMEARLRAFWTPPSANNHGRLRHSTTDPAILGNAAMSMLSHAVLPEKVSTWTRGIKLLKPHSDVLSATTLTACLSGALRVR
jgi:hypothetical protein